MAICLSIAGGSAKAQTPVAYANVGRTPTQQEISDWDTAISIDGKGLPPGSGTAKDGAPVFMAKCSACHGPNLDGVKPADPYAIGPALVGGMGTLTTSHPVKTVGSYWPYATMIWDYVNRAMPRGQEHTLTPNQVYLVTAFILFKNGIIKEDDVIDAKTLPKVQMPNRNGFLPARFEDIPDLQKRGCHQGQCPELTGSK